LRDDADAAEPLGPAAVDDLLDLEVCPTAEGRHLGDEQTISRRPGPQVDTDGFEAIALAKIASMTGRSGASPMPPATMTTSPP
jgi:hypothetical protein